MGLDSHLDLVLSVQRAAAGDGGDACFSPYSIAGALDLVARAANGRTSDELRALLGEGQDELLRVAAEVGDRAEFAVANTLWASDRITIDDAFLADLVAQPGGKAETAPFATDPGGARELINADVDRTTHGLIPQLLPEGAIHADTRASLVNALYLKAGWRYPFPEQATAPAPFHSPGGPHDVPTMHLVETIGYADEAGWQVVTLPAQGGVEAVILLPGEDLATAEAALDGRFLQRLLESPRRQKVRLSLPKISLDVRTDLDPALHRLGVRELFTPDADLTGLSPDRPLWVDSVLHQAVLRLDEQGLEGAAATAVQMRTMSLVVAEPVVVTVDRPFLLLVRHAATGAVYFSARVVRPA